MKVTMKVIINLLAGLFLSLALVLSPFSTSVSANSPAVGISPTPINTYGTGTNFWVNVNIVSVTSLNNYQFNITYDPTVIQVVGNEGGAGVTAGQIVDSTTNPPTTYNFPITWSFSPPGTPSGTITISGNLPSGQGANSTGNGDYLARINFQVVGAAGQASTITPSNVNLKDTSNLAIPITSGSISSGSVSIPYPSTQTVSISAPATVPVGGDFVARVNISLVNNLNAYQFVITYNPSIIQVTGAEGGSGVTGGLIGSTAIPVDWWLYYPQGQPGTIRVLGHAAGNSAATGTGYLAEVHFHVVGTPNQVSNLAFTTAGTFTNKLFDIYGNPFPNVTWTSTSVMAFASFWITTNSPLPTGELNIAYSQTLGAYGGTTPYTWSILGGSLPSGLGLNPSTGAITGTPTSSGSTTATVGVNDSSSPTKTANKDLAITIAPTPTITTNTPLPNGEITAPYSQTLAVTGGVGPYTWLKDSGSLPDGLTLSSAGVISGTPTSAGGYTAIIRVTDYVGGTNTKSLSITIIAGPAITTGSPLPNGEVNKTYSQALAATGGVTPYTWSIISGSLPGGLTLSSAGVIGGMPNASGSSTATIKVTDSAGGSVNKDFSITIVAAPTITTSSTLPNGEVNRPYSQTLALSGGVAPYTWTVQSGNLPTGLSLSLAGVISGTPTSATSSLSVTVSVVDAYGASATKTFYITIVAAPTITTTSPLPNGQVGIPYSKTLTASGGVTPYTWTWVSGSLPDGLSFVSGAITGTPTTAGGPFTITIGMTDSMGGGATGDFSITIFTSPVITTNSPLSTGEAGKSYSQTLSVAGGTAAYTWTVLSGTLPANLSLNASTGAIMGTPFTASGPNIITFKVTDSFNVVATKDLSITVVAAPVITTASTLPNGEGGIGYSQTLAVTGGIAPYAWALQSGSLPGGLSLSSTGVISGTPTGGGYFSATISVTDGLVGIATKTISITIVTAPVITTASPLPNGETGIAYSQALAATGGVTPYNWLIVSGSLPSGLTLSSAGVIGGMPNASGSSTATVKLTDNAGGSVNKDFSITIVAAPTITTSSPLPNGEVNVIYSQTLAVAGGVSPYTWTLISGSLPGGLSLNSTGTVTGNPFMAGGPVTATVKVTDGYGATATKDISITIVATPTIITASLPNGEVGQSYSQTLAVSGGMSPYTWTVQSGTLPAGLSLSPAGVISGTPTSAGGPTTIIFKVTDTNNQYATIFLSITIIAGPVITTDSPLPNGQIGLSYSQTLAASGGVSPYTWAMQSGSLPAGLTLSSAGAITGIPNTAGGPTNFTIKATDSLGGFVLKNFSITVVTGPVITTTSPLPTGEVGISYSQTLAISGGTAPYTWSKLSGSLPAGLSVSSSGTISGTPTAAGGPTTATIKVTDGLGAAATRDLSITIVAAPIITTASPLPNGETGVSYLQNLAVAGGISPFSWTVTSGSLPAGLSLNPSTGAISGTPNTAGGPTTVTIKVKDNLGANNSKAMSITIIAAPAITTASSLPNGQTGMAYSQTLAVSGGTAPITWSATGLPSGLSMSFAGAISGAPAASGDFNVVVTVTDSFVPANSVSKTFSLHINATLQISTALLPEVLQGKVYSKSLDSSGGASPYTWNATGLPAGLSMSTAGVISGMPTVWGTFTINITVTDSFNSPNSVSRALTLKVYMPYDANGNGVIDMGDVVKIDRIILQLDPRTPAADANGDGIVDSGDITKIERVILGIDN